NAAILVKDSDAQSILVETVLDVLKDEIKMNQLKNNITSFAQPNAANLICDEILKLVK
ncbi:MAG: UDP-N-acetylglucosamine--N-acetylmuramyl-(pentapeptide) pyrophosphoryl-undecaprenol N-acetylglucosamine transferase, partial [Cytophagales bacterium]